MQLAIVTGDSLAYWLDQDDDHLIATVLDELEQRAAAQGT